MTQFTGRIHAAGWIVRYIVQDVQEPFWHQTKARKGGADITAPAGVLKEMHASPSEVRLSSMDFFSVRQHWMIHPHVRLGRPLLLKSRGGQEERRHFKQGSGGAQIISNYLHSLLLISLLPAFLCFWLLKEEALCTRVTAGTWAPSLPTERGHTAMLNRVQEVQFTRTQC